MVQTIYLLLTTCQHLSKSPNWTAVLQPRSRTLKSIFARHGIPEIVVTDNCPQYSSQTFTAFAYAREFTHRTSSPRYTPSHGVSERTVKTIKGLLRKSEDQYETLLAYMATPFSNGYSTTEILMGRKIRTTVPVVPSLLDPQWSHFKYARKTQCENMQRQKKAFDKCHRVVDMRPLKPGEHVMQVPSRSYLVKTQQGDVRRNHRQLNPTPVEPTYDALPADVDIPIDVGQGRSWITDGCRSTTRERTSTTWAETQPYKRAKTACLLEWL